MANEQQWQNKKGHSLFLIEKFMGVLFFSYSLGVLFFLSEKKGNHEEHEDHKEELFSSLVVFVAQGFYAFCDNLASGFIPSTPSS